jgi:hypothetical protein
MMSGMPDDDNTSEAPESILCKSCGLCCTGHLFSWVRLDASELDHSEAFGLNVIRSDPRQRGFTQPCPVWDGICTIYASPHYPRGCRKYQCKLLKQMIDEAVQLPESLEVIQQAMAMIREVEELLPASPRVSFRERLVAQMEQGKSDPAFLVKANALLAFFEHRFGVNDFLDQPAGGTAGR